MDKQVRKSLDFNPIEADVLFQALDLLLSGIGSKRTGGRGPAPSDKKTCETAEALIERVDALWPNQGPG
jgi:hypothetical protein